MSAPAQVLVDPAGGPAPRRARLLRRAAPREPGEHGDPRGARVVLALHRVRGRQGDPGRVAVTTMIRSDPPVHTRLRRMVAKDFMPKAVEGYRDFVCATIDARIESLASLPQPVDLIESFALAVPSDVIAKILGVPREDEAMFQELTERMTTLSLSREEQYEVIGEFAAFCDRLISLKESQPADDLLT